ncbi:MAG: hypothetical protein ACXWV9_04960 [Flavisolibacter sp.]
MNNTLTIAITLISVLFLSCRSSYFNSPNDLRYMEGTVFLNNGKTIDGKISVNSSGFLSSPLKVYTEEEKKPMQFPLRDIKSYRIRNDYFDLKNIRGGISVGQHAVFMRRLTKEDSRIHLYEHMVQSNNKQDLHRNRYDIHYFMEIPSENSFDVWPVEGSKFVPEFDEKMSKLVADCPDLSRKIADKEEGYFYRQVTVFREKRMDVLLNIIEEYNRCR